MDKAPTFVGIDVAKRRLDIHSRPTGESSTFGHDDESVAALVGRLAALAPATLTSIVIGLALLGLSLPRGERSEHYAGWDRFVL